jgi:hypothetical protein
MLESSQKSNMKHRKSITGGFGTMWEIKKEYDPFVWEVFNENSDLIVENAKLRREVNKSLRLLEDAFHAINNGRTEIASEFVERVINNLKNEMETRK